MLDINEIKRRIPHRYPMLLVDRVQEAEDGVRGVGTKAVTINEPFFQGHFPADPIMPGCLLLESMAQVSGVVLSTEADGAAPKYLAAVNDLKFFRRVVPGDTLTIEVALKRRIGNFVVVDGVVRVRDVVVSSGELVFPR